MNHCQKLVFFWSLLFCADRTAANPAFPLKLSADGRHLVDRRATPFLVMGDSPWSLMVEPAPDQLDRYLDDRKARGFNVLLVNLTEHKFASRPPNLLHGTPLFTTPGKDGTGDSDWMQVLEKETDS